jgi:hypothetical protein
MAEQTMSVGANLAVALQRNRELTIELYTMRNESPPDDSGSVHSLQPEPAVGDRPKAWEVYAVQPGIDSLYTGIPKRTPSGGFFTS